jgi:hypothetical protein
MSTKTDARLAELYLARADGEKIYRFDETSKTWSTVLASRQIMYGDKLKSELEDDFE